MPEADWLTLLGLGELALGPIPHDRRVEDLRTSILLPELRVTTILFV
jgi:hypothetical protein